MRTQGTYPGPLSVPDWTGNGNGSDSITDTGDSPRNFSETSHSFSLSGKNFSMDFTWRRAESQPGPLAAGEAQPASKPQRERLSAPAPSFQELLRRKQLAGLLAPASRPPADRVELTLEQPAAVTPSPGYVVGAYQATDQNQQPRQTRKIPSA